MTREQFAMAVNADAKWVENAARLLSRSLEYSRSEARWMGLIRLFSHDLGIPLKESAELAGEAIRHPESTHELRLEMGSSAIIAVVVDLSRFYSMHNAALSAAMIFAVPRKRGRRPRGANKSPTIVRERATYDTPWDVLARAEASGIDLDALREGLNDSPAQRLQRLQDNASLIAEIRASTRKASHKLRRDRKGRAK